MAIDIDKFFDGVEKSIENNYSNKNDKELVVDLAKYFKEECETKIKLLMAADKDITWLPFVNLYVLIDFLLKYKDGFGNQSAIDSIKNAASSCRKAIKVLEVVDGYKMSGNI